MSRAINLSGKRFGRLYVISRAEKPSHVKNNKPYWLCKCDCGNEKVVIGADLRGGKTQSCGCLMIERVKESNTKHGMRDTRLYNIWQNMRARCNYSGDDSYEHYGGRGITVCNRWNNSFEMFVEDMYDSYIDFENRNGRDSATIDRIDVNGNYEPENCRWATVLEQNRNKRDK